MGNLARQEKRVQRLTFWVRRPPGGVGVFHAKGVVAKKLVSLGFEERNLGYPGSFAGMSRTPGGVQKVCAKNVCAHFSFPDLARQQSGTFRNPQPPGIFSKATPAQMGGVLQYKWEAYCSTNERCIAAFPFLQGLEASKAQCYKWGGVLRYKLEVYCQYFSDKLYGLGVPGQCPNKKTCEVILP